MAARPPQHGAERVLSHHALVGQFFQSRFGLQSAGLGLFHLVNRRLTYGQQRLLRTDALVPALYDGAGVGQLAVKHL